MSTKNEKERSSHRVCSFENCPEEATTFAVGKTQFYETEPPGHPGVHAYCEVHAEKVANERSPEYVESCPNCGCKFGVK